MSMYFKKDTFDVKFFIDQKDTLAAFVGLKKYFQHLSLEKIDVGAVMASITLDELISACRWTATFDNFGNIIDIAPIYDNVGDEEFLFEGIAEFVKNGSYVEYQRESNDANLKFRFEFNKEFIIRKWAEHFDPNGKQYWEDISDY